MSASVRTGNLRRASRKRILTAARTCFANFGFQATTMDMIAERGGMSVGAIYRIYSQKPALIEDVVRREVARWLIHAHALLGRADAVGSCLGSLSVAKVVPEWTELRLYVETMAEAARNPTIARIVASCDRHLRSAIIHVLTTRAGCAAELGEETNALADVLLTVLDGVFLRATCNRGPRSEVIADAFRLIWELRRQVGEFSVGKDVGDERPVLQ